jgi:hypothetical protein
MPFMIDDLTLPPVTRERLERELLGAFDGPALAILARRLGIELRQISEGSLRQVVSQFVDEVARLGQGRALIRTARRLNPTHPGLNDLLATLLWRRFKGPQIAELEQILGQVEFPRHLLEGHFCSCVPSTWSTPLASELQTDKERLAELLDVLSEFPENGSGQVFPLFDFVLRLRNCPEAGAVAERLDTWLERTAVALGKDPQAIKAHGYRLVGELWLMVKVERVTAEGFQVAAWLADGQSRYPRPIFQEEQSWKWSELPDVLRRILGKRELLEPLKVLGAPKLTIEFLLPRELLLRSVESWQIVPRIPMGAQYQVVVRSLERTYAEVKPPLEVELQALELATIFWNDKWRALSGTPQPPPRPVWVSEGTNHLSNSFIADLALPEVVCMAMALTPPALSEATLSELLHQCLLQGLPIALWVRKPGCAGAEVRTFLERLLKDLNTLPGQVRQARWNGFRSDDEGDFGNHLTLLWDDPTRLPEDARPGSDFSAPFTAGVKG